MEYLNGMKSYIAAAGLVGLGIYHLSQGHVDLALQDLMAALAVLGIRHSVSKLETKLLSSSVTK